MTIITLSGKAESGKDTVAKILKYKLEDLGYSVLICHYADLLKYICKTFFGWNGQKDLEGRTLLQRVGTEGIRSQRPDYWVDFIKDILHFFPNEWDYVLIPDCRFPNEVDSLKDFDVIPVKVTRPNYENHLTEEQRQHPSETMHEHIIFSYEIVNNGMIKNATDKVQDFINWMFEKDMQKSLLGKIKEKLE